jgi:phosphoglycolate phosphatase-like HAD superfamily hydrolase
MIKLVFFDWNGTLLSDGAAHTKAENHVLSMFNIEPVTMARIQETFDIPITRFYSALGVNEELFFKRSLEIQETYHRFYEKYAEHCQARGGTEVLLRWLHSEGIRSVILSNHTIEGIEPHLKRLKLEKYIDAILANDDIIHTGLRDKAKRAEDYMTKNKFGAEQILVVGDTPEEARIARQLGAKSVLILDGWCSERRLKEAKPNYVVGKLDRIVGIITDIRTQTTTARPQKSKARI